MRRNWLPKSSEQVNSYGVIKDIIENYQSLFDYQLEVRSEYYSLIGRIKNAKYKKNKSEINGRIERLKNVMELNKKQLIELDDKITFHASALQDCPCTLRWIDFNKGEKSYREKLRKSEKKMNDGLIQNSYIRESIINNLIELEQNEQI